MPPEVQGRDRDAAVLALSEMIAKNGGSAGRGMSPSWQPMSTLYYPTRWFSFSRRSGWQESACTGSKGTYRLIEDGFRRSQEQDIVRAESGIHFRVPAAGPSVRQYAFGDSHLCT